MPDGAVLSTLEPIAEEALSGLRATPKTLPPKLFYDEAGCQLFGQITQLPEYYPTRTERALLHRYADPIVRAVGAGTVLVEYGASSEDKAVTLLDAMAAAGRPAPAYVPIDVAAEALTGLQRRMRGTHPALDVYPVCGDFSVPLSLPRAVRGRRCVGFFPGSTIGNMDPPMARRFLAEARVTLGADAAFLVGVDLRKSPAVLVPAYDDAAGVTAAFNLNLLVRLNHEAGADFDLRHFAHRAIWNERDSRIEMHLVSGKAQTVHVAGVAIEFAAGETIHTENSYKHSVSGFQALAAASGWLGRDVWVDEDELFSVHLLA